MLSVVGLCERVIGILIFKAFQLYLFRCLAHVAFVSKSRNVMVTV